MTHPDTEFVPLGGTAEVEKDAILIGEVLNRLFNSIKIAELKTKSIKVLRRRDLENYLWDDEVLTKLCITHNQAAAATVLIAEKQNLVNGAKANGKPDNDIKWVSRRLYNEAKRLLVLTGCGNNAMAFARDSLAPLITPGMAVYDELEADLFGP